MFDRCPTCGHGLSFRFQTNENGIEAQYRKWELVAQLQQYSRKTRNIWEFDRFTVEKKNHKSNLIPCKLIEHTYNIPSVCLWFTTNNRELLFFLYKMNQCRRLYWPESRNMNWVCKWITFSFKLTQLFNYFNWVEMTINHNLKHLKRYTIKS